jgi:hypothetical protein
MLVILSEDHRPMHGSPVVRALRSVHSASVRGYSLGAELNCAASLSNRPSPIRNWVRFVVRPSPRVASDSMKDVIKSKLEQRLGSLQAQHSENFNRSPLLPPSN